MVKNSIYGQRVGAFLILLLSYFARNCESHKSKDEVVYFKHQSLLSILVPQPNPLTSFNSVNNVFKLFLYVPLLYYSISEVFYKKLNIVIEIRAIIGTVRNKLLIYGFDRNHGHSGNRKQITLKGLTCGAGEGRKK